MKVEYSRMELTKLSESALLKNFNASSIHWISCTSSTALPPPEASLSIPSSRKSSSESEPCLRLGFCCCDFGVGTGCGWLGGRCACVALPPDFGTYGTNWMLEERAGAFRCAYRADCCFLLACCSFWAA